MTLRLASTCVFAAPTVLVCDRPSASQIWRYMGTIAKPKPSMPTAMTRSFPISTRLLCSSAALIA